MGYSAGVCMAAVEHNGGDYRTDRSEGVGPRKAIVAFLWYDSQPGGVVGRRGYCALKLAGRRDVGCCWTSSSASGLGMA